MRILYRFIAFGLSWILIYSCTISRPEVDNSDKISFNVISDDSLLTVVQHKTFSYYWEGAEPVSGMARERYHVNGIYPQNDMNIITTGGSGFGIMALLTGVHRGFITRKEAVDRLTKIVNFLEKADRYHGAWPHWLNGETGKVKPFSAKDDGADIVETAFLMEGLLTAKQFFINGNEKEKELADKIDALWRNVEWSWFTNGGKNVLYWHWSPKYAFEINLEVRGWDECLILYVLAASSTTYPISEKVYNEGWARNGNIISSNEKYGRKLILKHNYAEEYGGPLFWSHYSFLGLNPTGLSDKYADYWKVNLNHTLINRQWCVENPNKYKGYGSKCWGLTASYSMEGYAAHAPGKDRDIGVISPTAALSAFPYTPEYSMEALKYFYYEMGDKIFGKYGFYDAFSINYNWFPQNYLAIDQGPIIVMIENYRSGLLWKYFMQNPEIQEGLKKLGFSFIAESKEGINTKELIPTEY